MIYGYEVEKTPEGFVAKVAVLGMTTKPQESEDAAGEVLREGMSGFIELQYRRRKKPIPVPDKMPEAGNALYIPIKLQLRILLWNTMMEKHISQTELAQLLKITRQQVQRYVDGSDTVSVEKYEQALIALDVCPTVELR